MWFWSRFLIAVGLCFLGGFGPFPLQNLNAEITGTKVFIETDKDLVVFQDMTVPPEKIYDSVVVIRGNIDFAGKTRRLVVVNGQVHLRSSAEVSDQLILMQGQIQREEGSKVPEKVETSVSAWQWAKDRWNQLWNKSPEDRGLFWNLLTLPFYILAIFVVGLFLFILAFLFFFIAPNLTGRAERLLRDSPIRSLIWGVISYLSVVPLAVLLMLTIVGILLLPFYIFMVVMIGAAGLFCGFRSLGTLVLQNIGIRHFIPTTLLGMILAFAISFTPFVGPVLFSILWMLGTGSLIRSFLSTDEDFDVKYQFAA